MKFARDLSGVARLLLCFRPLIAASPFSMYDGYVCSITTWLFMEVIEGMHGSQVSSVDWESTLYAVES